MESTAPLILNFIGGAVFSEKGMARPAADALFRPGHTIDARPAAAVHALFRSGRKIGALRHDSALFRLR